MNRPEAIKTIYEFVQSQREDMTKSCQNDGKKSLYDTCSIPNHAILTIQHPSQNADIYTVNTEYEPAPVGDASIHVKNTVLLSPENAGLQTKEKKIIFSCLTTNSEAKKIMGRHICMNTIRSSQL